MFHTPDLVNVVHLHIGLNGFLYLRLIYGLLSFQETGLKLLIERHL